MRLALLLFLSLTTAFGAEAKKYNFRTDFSLGRYVDGPRITPAMQKDKGTLLLVWAYEVEAPRSGETLKGFQKIADEHKEDLVVIGIEGVMVGGTSKNLAALIKKAGISYSIYSGFRSPIKSTLYPQVYAFDRDGKMVYGGSPNAEELMEAIEKAAAKPEKKDGKEDPKKDEKPKADPKKAA